MATWLIKTEPTEYSFADLQREKKAAWTGVSNPVALKNIRAMKTGDALLFYHTGKEKAVVALAKVVSDPYPDPKDAALTIFDAAPVKPLKTPVTLAAIKADPRFKDFLLVRIGRLSVMPVAPEIEAAILKMAGE